MLKFQDDRVAAAAIERLPHRSVLAAAEAARQDETIGDLESSLEQAGLHTAQGLAGTSADAGPASPVSFW